MQSDVHWALCTHAQRIIICCACIIMLISQSSHAAKNCNKKYSRCTSESLLFKEYEIPTTSWLILKMNPDWGWISVINSSPWICFSTHCIFWNWGFDFDRKCPPVVARASDFSAEHIFCQSAPSYMEATYKVSSCENKSTMKYIFHLCKGELQTIHFSIQGKFYPTLFKTNLHVKGSLLRMFFRHQ